MPGKDLLGALRSRLQTDYGVSFGNPRLVEEFSLAEVHPELASVLREVAAVAGVPSSAASSAALRASTMPEDANPAVTSVRTG
ncbi:MAG: hypothetical protein ACHQ01_04460 [Candidatus Limnocylindrales bacterium]